MVQQVNASGNQDIDGLLWGYRWDTSTVLTFSFPTSPAVYTGYGAISGFEAFNAAQQTAVSQALAMIGSYVSGLSFTMVAAGSPAELRFAEANVANGITVSTAFGYFPGTALSAAGDSWFNHTHYNSPGIGTFAMQAGIMHEIGHNMGLKHGHETANSYGYTFPVLPTDHDSYEYSVMTYRQYVGDNPGSGDNAPHHATTYMINDIAAMQYMYGANFNTNSGNTTYTWSNSSGQFIINNVGQGASVVGNYIFMSIWDGNGIDTYNLSNFSTNLVIDLRPGLYTVVPGMLANLGDGRFARGSIYNAYQYNGDARSLIENAIGGSGIDSLVGNATDNVLRGNGGNDSLDGLGGTDTVAFTGTFGQYSFSITGALCRVTDNIAGRDGVDQMLNIEWLQFTDQTVTVASVQGPYSVEGSWSGLSGWSVLGTGDFNADGDADVIWRNNSSGQTDEWIMQGGGVAGGRTLAINTIGWTVVGIGDFNADGDSDVLWRNNSTGQTDGWMMQGGVISSGYTLSTNTNGWTLVGVGDFNADGDSDVLWRQNTTGQTDTWNMQNGAIIGSTSVSFNTVGWSVLGVGDFNGDGDSDVLWRNNSSGQTDAWSMQNGYIAGGNSLSASTTGWTMAGMGDFDGDSDIDILWKATDGTFYTWEMQSGLVSTTHTVTQAASLTVYGVGDFDNDNIDEVMLGNSSTGSVVTWSLSMNDAGIAQDGNDGFGVMQSDTMLV